MTKQDDIATIQDFLNQGGTLQALFNLDPVDLDCIYAYACQLFETGDYAGAKRYYMLLSRFSHWQYDYWLALGLCCQRLEEHDQAIFCFGQAGLLRLDDPQPPYLAGLSYCQCAQLKQATKAFKTALKWCADKADHLAIKREIQLQLLALEQEIQP
ncbi:SycD/LcrH family type III secretion system chaperone [Salmonella enterica]|nr:CesD/SycD/LcrH family type III secretion system chaperone [Salmonella enterica subsp. enterica serovar Sandiego]EEC0251689.1 CesD/SycD/LcrH family type III secretion system chaperone [Salmonella enterica subsp. enterica]EJW2129030.1 SycD/LcrH family type III secretion system chaperone [Salmonella enterica]EEE4266513.1 CesD/SycD/LcrH family type III secretion system chaperone [Salmonella enterica subsp. enterica serovar Sandiego]EKT1704962.1 SycD/LcrH family type III secretion system chaperon